MVYILEAANVMKGRLKKSYHTFIFLFSLRIEQTMAHQQTQDNPNPKNIIPDNTKQRHNATDCAQGLDSYFKTVEATTKPRAGPCKTQEVCHPCETASFLYCWDW